MNETNELRRTLLKGGCAAGIAAVAASAGLLVPGRALAAEWNKAAFQSKGIPDALKVLGAAAVAESKDILIKSPDIAENGAVVPVEVMSQIPGTEFIAILADKNPLPLMAVFDFVEGAQGYVSTRIKMGQTSSVRVVVKAGGKYYGASREIKVTIGGCGG